MDADPDTHPHSDADSDCDVVSHAVAKPDTDGPDTVAQPDPDGSDPDTVADRVSHDGPDADPDAQPDPDGSDTIAHRVPGRVTGGQFGKVDPITLRLFFVRSRARPHSTTRPAAVSAGASTPPIPDAVSSTTTM